MTPIEVSDSVQKNSGNYAGEAKTECLLLCTGLGALHNHKMELNHSTSPPRSEFRPTIANSRLAALKNSERFNLSSPNRQNGVLHKTVFPNEIASQNLKSKAIALSNQPHMVKVSVYTKAVNPYIVIYDSNKKYAKPAAYLKLSNCVVKAGSHANKSAKLKLADNDDDDDCIFRLFPSKHEDIDSAGIITFKTSTTEKRNEWVEFLESVSSGQDFSIRSSSGYIPRSSVLPTLVEQDDNIIEEDSSSPSDSLKAPSRRKMRGGRRNSLNSLGMRLRCYTVGKDRL